MFRLGRLYYTSRGFDLLASLKKCNNLFTRDKIRKQLAFLVVSSSSSLKSIAQNFKPLVLTKSPYFHGFWYFYIIGSPIMDYVNRVMCRASLTMSCNRLDSKEDFQCRLVMLQCGHFV